MASQQKKIDAIVIDINGYQSLSRPPSDWSRGSSCNWKGKVNCDSVSAVCIFHARRTNCMRRTKEEDWWRSKEGGCKRQVDTACNLKQITTEMASSRTHRVGWCKLRVVDGRGGQTNRREAVTWINSVQLTGRQVHGKTGICKRVWLAYILDVITLLTAHGESKLINSEFNGCIATPGGWNVGKQVRSRNASRNNVLYIATDR